MKRVGALIAVVVIAGCGTLNGPRTGAISPPTDALARWQDFPADQSPRPIVLLCTDTPGQGFDTNEGKIAYLCGKFAFRSPARRRARAVGSELARWHKSHLSGDLRK